MYNSKEKETILFSSGISTVQIKTNEIIINNWIQNLRLRDAKAQMIDCFLGVFCGFFFFTLG